MPSDNDLLVQILEQLKRISDDLSVLQQDVNCIRNGEYDEPKGAAYRMKSGGPVGARGVGDDEGLGKPSRDW